MQLTIIVRKAKVTEIVYIYIDSSMRRRNVCVWAEFLCSIYCIAGKFGDELFLANQGGRQNEKLPLAIDVWHDRQK